MELLIECDRYISAEGRKRLFSAHDGITAVIPVSRDGIAEGDSGRSGNIPDLGESMEKIFRSYFEYAKGSEPDEGILELFREITAVTDSAAGGNV